MLDLTVDAGNRNVGELAGVVEAFTTYGVGAKAIKCYARSFCEYCCCFGPDQKPPERSGVAVFVMRYI